MGDALHYHRRPISPVTHRNRITPFEHHEPVTSTHFNAPLQSDVLHFIRSNNPHKVRSVTNQSLPLMCERVQLSLPHVARSPQKPRVFSLWGLLSFTAGIGWTGGGFIHFHLVGSGCLSPTRRTHPNRLARCEPIHSKALFGFHALAP